MTASDKWGSPQRGAAAKQSAHPRVAQYLVFTVSGMEMGVSLAHVSEIVPYERVSAVPGTPPFVRGVVHVRGRVIPVIDLAVKLQRVPEPVGKRTCILMVELQVDGRTVPLGLVMDGVATLLDVEITQIQPPPRFGTDVEVRYLEGLVAREGGMLPLLDVALVFGADELAQVARTASTATSGKA